jgi:hypothetical protein
VLFPSPGRRSSCRSSIIGPPLKNFLRLQGALQHNVDSGNYQRHAGVIMYDSAAETANRLRNTGDGHLVSWLSLSLLSARNLDAVDVLVPETPVLSS